jgi:flagellar biogenesis protein FliO
MLQQTLAVFLVLGLLLAALWLLRRQGLATFRFVTSSRTIGFKRSPDRRMHVIERVALTPQHSLHLVSIENRLIVFAASPTGCLAVDHITLSSMQNQEQTPPFRNGAAC